jgi:putative membrane protein
MKQPQYLSSLVQSTWRIVKSEMALFKSFPRLWLAAIAIAVVPAAYALIYLTSVWDPSAKTNALPVGIVNLDEGFSYQGRVTNVGSELTDELIKLGTFGFRTLNDADAARQAVRRGKLAFAVIFPKDFSATAVPGVRPGDARVTIVFSEGNNYAAASFARRFAAELGHQVNEALNEKRWEQVLMSVDGTGRNLGKLTAGVTQLRTGAKALSEGMGRYNRTASQLVSGFKQVGSGIRTMESMLPSDDDLKTLKAGAQRLALRQRDMGAGLEQIQTGARKLTEGATQMQEQTADIPFIGDKLAAKSGELAAGGGQLTEGLTTALDANAQLARGASRVETGVVKLTDGMSALGDGIHRMADKLPEDSRLDAFGRGGEELASGAARLRAGIELIGSELPHFGSSARGLADSVEPTLEVLAPVANNGSAFAPNMVAMALWLGAVMAVYLFNLHDMKAEHAGATELAKTLGKFAVPSLIVLVQTVLTFLMLVYGLGIAVPNFLSFTFAMFVAGQAFLAIVFLLLRAFGEAGKLFVVLLLTLQLAAGGGVMPIELSGGFFQAVHDWLPFTWVIKAFRGSLFGAYDNAWLHSLADVVFSGVLALLLATFVKRWKTVAATDYKPGIEV